MGTAASVERLEYETTLADKVVQAKTDAEKLALFDKIQALTVAGMAKKSPSSFRTPGSRVSPASRSTPKSPASTQAIYDGPPPTSMDECFHSFVPSGLMDGKTWMKFCGDCDLLKKSYNRQDADMTFVTVNKKEKKMGFQAFNQCLVDVAKRRGISMDRLYQICLDAGGPTTSGTIADRVALADDKSKFTGTAKKGGPKTVDDGGVTMENQLDRTSADVRGVKAENY